MKTNLLTVAMLAGFLAVSLPPATAREAGRRRVSGTDVSLIPPRDFREAKNFTGFENPKVSASIVVRVFRAGIGNFIAGVTDERMKAGGLTVLSRQKLEVDDKQALLLKAAQDNNGSPYLKWILYFGDGSQSAQLVGEFPKDNESRVSSLIKNALLTAKFGARGGDFGEDEAEPGEAARPDASAEKLSTLPFKITPAEPLKLAEVVNKVMMLTRTGRYPIEEPGDPIFVAGKAAAAVASADRKKFATERLKKTATLKDIEVGTVKEVTIDGLPGFEITARAKHDPTGRLLVLYQVMLFTDDSYYLLQGMGLLNADPGFLEPFQKTAQSFKR